MEGKFCKDLRDELCSRHIHPEEANFLVEEYLKNNSQPENDREVERAANWICDNMDK